MEITERLIRRIARQEFGQMAKSGPYTRGSGGGSSYTLPVAADGVLGGVQLGYPTSAANRYYAVQLDSSQRAYVNVPWTDHYAWGDITGKPDFADVATSGSYNDLSNKPSIPSVSGSVSGSTLTITINGTSYSLTDTNTWRPVQNNLDSTATGDSLSAYQGYLLARGSARDDSKLPLAGGTMTGNIYIGNTTIYASGSNGGINSLAVADDCILGDCNIGGHLGLKSLNTTQAGISFYSNSGVQQGQITAYNGNIGIGTDSPSYKLHVAGTIYATGSITERSDIRCKDVETYQWSPTLDMIADAPIIRYTMKDDKTHRMRVGTVAQYWEKVIPETVSKDNEGILSIAQGDICMVNVIALAREVRKLREEVKLLRNGRS